MSVETAIVNAIGILFIGLSWLGFKFSESKSDLYKYLGILFIALGVAMLQVLGWVAVEMSLGAASVSYLSTGLVQPIYWVLNIALFLFWLILLLKALVLMALATIDAVKRHTGRGLDG